MAESSNQHHPMGGRRRKTKGPPSQAVLPDLPPRPAVDDSSDDCGEEKEVNRPRSTSTTPGSGKGLEPFKYDKLMGIPLVGSSSEDVCDGSETETEVVDNREQPGVTSDLHAKPDSSSGVGESSRGIGSAMSRTCDKL